MRRILGGPGDLTLGSAGVPGANGYFRDEGGGARLGGNRKPEAARPFILQRSVEASSLQNLTRARRPSRVAPSRV